MRTLLLFTALSLQAQDPIEPLLNQAKDLVAKQSYESAIEVYSKAIIVAPKDPRPYLERGHRYLNTRQISRGISDLTKANKLAPNSSEIIYHLGLAHYLSGNYSKALKIFDPCLKTKTPLTGKDPMHSCGTDPVKYPGGRMDMIAWAYRAARHSGNNARAKEILSAVPPGLKLDAGGDSYYRALLYNQGRISADEVLAGLKGPAFVGAGFGIADFLVLEGKPGEACPILKRVVENKEGHYGWGAIAGEKEIKRSCPGL